MLPSDDVPPRVLLVCYSLARGGAERVTVELANAWVRQGLSVIVVTMAPADTDFYVLANSVRHIRLPFPTSSKGTSKLLANNVPRLRAIRKILRDFKPHAALGMMSTSAVLLSVAGIGLPGRRFGSERTYPPMQTLPLGRGPIRKYAYGMLDGVICQTNAAAAWVAANTWARATPIAPNPITLPLPRHDPHLRPSAFLAADDHCLLAVGRFSEEKQFGKLIATFRQLAHAHPTWKLVIVGDGPEREALLQDVVRASLSDRILLPGPSGNIGDWYSRADLFVLSSRYEGFPNVLLEALAHGTPAVAFDCLAGPADILEGHRAGLLIPPGDFNALGIGLSQLMASEELRANFARAAPDVLRRFSRDCVLNLWNDALGLPTDGRKVPADAEANR